MRRIIQQGIIPTAGHFLEGGSPALPRPPGWPDDQSVAASNDLELSVQAGSLQEPLGNADSVRVSDSNDA
jgi:hypothetical protein